MIAQYFQVIIQPVDDLEVSGYPLVPILSLIFQVVTQDCSAFWAVPHSKGYGLTKNLV